MSVEDLQYYLDICRSGVDIEVFGAALTVEYINRLILNGGSEVGRSDWYSSIRPSHIQNFVERAVVFARKINHFEREWLALQQALPHLHRAWEKGQALFQADLARAATNQQEMEYLSLIDFAVDCYAYISAKNTYPNDSLLRAWAINGYIVAWRQIFYQENVRNELQQVGSFTLLKSSDEYLS